MTRRAAPGQQLGVGRLRVDAARAVAKLRAYQLADKTAWVLEAIRAAVAAGATMIELRGDSNDVWLRWDGAPWPAEDLPRLLDELVSPEAATERHHVRLLAAAVNSALGLDPAYVDVISIGERGTAMRARFTPDVLDEPDPDAAAAGAPGAASALRRVQAIAVAAPAGAGPGMAVHLRRRVSLEVLAYLVMQREPPELGLARAACRDIAVPLRIGATVHGGRGLGHDVVRVPLGDGGFIAIVDADGAHPETRGSWIEFAERGVLLAIEPLVLGLGQAPGDAAAAAVGVDDAGAAWWGRRPEDLTSRLPIRVFVDGPRMPTNASRSQVRRDAHPIAAAEIRARALVPALLAELTARAPHDPRVRAAALSLLAAALDGPVWTWVTSRTPPALDALAALPLVFDATGQPRPVATAWRPYAYTGSAPLPVALAPWLGAVLWIPPGDAAACLLRGVTFDPGAMRRRHRLARRQLRAHDAFFSHAPQPPHVVARELPRMRVKLESALVAGSCLRANRFDGIAGEVCIHAGDGGSGTLVVLFHGREIERLVFDSAIAFEAVLDSTTLTPAERYRGVERDDAFVSLVRTMWAGVVHAVEGIAVALADGALPRGFDAHPELRAEIDGRIVRMAIALARDVGEHGAFAVALAASPVWPTANGAWASLDILDGERAVGIVEPGVDAYLPASRITVVAGHGDRRLLALALPRLWQVPYAIPARPSAMALAGKLALATGVALAIDSDGVRGPRRVRGAIGPAATAPEDGDLGAVIDALVGALPIPGSTAASAAGADSSVAFHHVGVELEVRACVATDLPFRIVVDSDAFVPSASWGALVDDAGVAIADLAAWKGALVVAAARALTGDWVEELVGDTAITLDGALGHILAAAFRHARPDDLLGPALAARLRAAPLVPQLGEPYPTSARALADAFSGAIPYLSPDTDALASELGGFAPILATPPIARLVGLLAGRPAIDGVIEVEVRRRAALRAARLAAHRAQPLYVASPPELHAVLRGADGQGTVGVGRDGVEVRVLVEGRPYAVIRRDGLPVAAIVEIDLARVGEELGGLDARTEDSLVSHVLLRAPSLLVTIARARPQDLGDATPARTLLARWLDGEAIATVTRTALCAAPAFATIQGQRVSLERASQPHMIAWVSTWRGDWLAPADGEAAEAYDEPVLAMPGDARELDVIVSRLLRGAVVDVTAEVARLQGRRRMARGLVPTPAVLGAAPAHVRRLADLGDRARAVGLGEIGLVAGDESVVVLHVGGVPQARAKLDVLPPVELAVEVPEDAVQSTTSPHPLSSVAQDLAVRLVKELVAQGSLSARLYPGLRSAVLATRLSFGDVAHVPMFETLDGRWLDGAAVAAQLADLDDVWAVTSMPDNSHPLDPRRFVLRLTTGELALARANGLAIIDAAVSLALDATARRNQARPAARTLETMLPVGTALAEVRLDGDGVHAPRGVVAVLAPTKAERRSLFAHRAMHPFDEQPDPCKWPTLAVIDDARLVPDRRWEAPMPDAQWREVVEAVRAASEQAFDSVVRPPDTAQGAEVIRPVHRDIYGDAGGARLQIRGALWLARPFDSETSVIKLITQDGSRAATPADGAGVGGVLYVHISTDEDDRDDAISDAERIDAAVSTLTTSVHGAMLRRLADNPGRRTDAALAHLAYGLALGVLQPVDARGVKFTGLRDRALDAAALLALIATDDMVADDGSELVRVIRLVRMKRRAAEMPAITKATAIVPTSWPDIPAPPRPRTLPQAAPSPAAPPHPIQPVVDAIRARLDDLGVRWGTWEVEDHTNPMASFDTRLRLAGNHPRLRWLAATGSDAWSDAAIDAIAAHVVTVLNVALTQITDAAEGHAIFRLLSDG